MKRLGVVCILILSFCGLTNSVYLAQHETSGTPLLCNIQNLSGCNIVAASQYSYVFGVPVAQYGIVFYGILFILAALEIAIFNRLLRRVLQITSLIGVIVSLCLTLIQVFLIGAFCIYCFASTIIALLVLVLASFIEPIRTYTEQDPPLPPPASAPHFRMPPAL